MTKCGIVYNLKDSPFVCTIGRITYHFSSRRHIIKFKDSLNDNRKERNAILSNRYKQRIEADELADMDLYRKIETRGFYVGIDGGFSEWPATLKYNGGKMTLQPLEMPCEPLTAQEH